MQERSSCGRDRPSLRRARAHPNGMRPSGTSLPGGGPFLVAAEFVLQGGPHLDTCRDNAAVAPNLGAVGQFEVVSVVLEVAERHYRSKRWRDGRWEKRTGRVHSQPPRPRRRPPAPSCRASPRPPGRSGCFSRPSARVLLDNCAIPCLGVQWKHTGGTADEFADLAVDTQGNRRRRAVTPTDRERVASQPQIE